MPDQICEMVVGYLRDDDGDVGDEIYCIEVATHLYENTRCCPDCAEGMREEGFNIIPIGDKPS